MVCHGVRIAIFGVGLAFFCSAVTSCKKREAEDGLAPAAPTPTRPSPAVSAYTGGAISKMSPLRVTFVEPVLEAEAINQSLETSPFKFDPSLEGTAIWNSRVQLQFRPHQPLDPETRYRGSLDLEALRGDLQGTLEFEFWAYPQSFEVHWSGLETENPNQPRRQRYQGSIITADVANVADVEQMVIATYRDKTRGISWTHDEDGRHHRFQIEGILRQEDPTSLLIRAEGEPIGVERAEERSIEVPGLNTFAVMSARSAEGQAIEIRFSDPLRRQQKLSGLITVDSDRNLRFSVQGNVVQVFSSTPWNPREKLTIRRGIANTANFRLKEARSFSITFEALKPSVRFVGSGVIVPSSTGVKVPIETANLAAVQVEAMRVSSKNLGQFLQVNDLGGDKELKRVGRVIWRGRMDLRTSPTQNNRWIRHGLDLSPLLKDDPQGLYRLRLSFLPTDIDYPCPDSSFANLPPPPVPQENEWFETEEASYWNSWGGNGYSYWDSYRRRKDPCHIAYYRKYDDHDITVSRNVLLSNVGVIAKKGEDGSLHVFATDLKTAKPLDQADVEIVNFQQEPLAHGTTTSSGLVRFQLTRRPFAVFVRKDGHLGTVRLHDAEALSLAHFDVKGTSVQRGLKGFFYGERGVWRPGDPIYLTFILWDPSQRLPENHPVHFSLRNSRGQTIQTLTRTDSTEGFYVFRTETAADAPTGEYTARVQVGGAVFTKVIRIETVVPNRLKIGFDFDTDLLQGPNASIGATLEAMWLHGAVAKNLKADVHVAFLPTTTSFPRFGDYIFDDPTRRFVSESEEVFSGQLDVQGKTRVTTAIHASGAAPGMLKAHFTTRVYERNGGSSVDRHTIDYSPYTRYLGIKTPKGDKARGMLLTDTEHTAELVAVDARGTPIDTEVEVKLFKIKWRWWWEKGPESLADYAGTTSYKPLAADRVSIRQGRGRWSFYVKYPDWGRYLLTVSDVNGNHRTGKIVYIDWPGWAGRAQKDNPGGAQVLTVATNQSSFNVGDEVRLTFPTAATSRALVSLETGSQVLQTAWVDPQGETTTYKLRATANMAPTIYAHVTVLQPYDRANNDLPMRLYGVVPIEVVDPKTRLHPVLETPSEFAPRSTQRVKVRERKGQSMAYTLAVVDEGLLGLTRFATPNAWGHFYARESIGVRTWDVFNQVAGAVAGELETLLAIGGGDGEEDEGGGRRANRFPPMVRFYGPFTLARGAVNTHEIDMPTYIGAVRVMVVAGHRGAYGSTDRSVPVRKPLMVLTNLPRVLGPGESLNVPVTVFALDPQITTVRLKVRSEGPIEMQQPEATLRFSEPGDQTVLLPLRIADQAGLAKVSVTAQGGNERFEQNTEIQIRHPNPPTTVVAGTLLAGTRKWSTDVPLPGAPGTNTVSVELSRTPPLNLAQRLDALVQYPHGCLEQTTSKAFPQLYLSRLLELDPQTQTHIDTNIREALKKIQTFQSESGGFVYWNGASQIDDWSTSWVGHFLVEAGKAGYVIPSGVLSQWKKYQRERSKRWSRSAVPQNDLDQAYRLYTLSLAGAPELAAMNRLRESNLDSTVAIHRLAAAYALSGQQDVARQIVAQQSVHVEPYRETGDTFGSEVRDTAMIAESLLLLGDAAGLVPMIQELSQTLGSDQFLSTHDVAFALVALSRFALENPTGQIGPLELTWEGQTRNVSLDKPLARIELPIGSSNRPTVLVHNRGNGSVFVRVAARGTPPPGSERPISRGLRLKVEYDNSTTRGPSSVQQGDDFVARVTVTNPRSLRTLNNIVLSQIIASGWEIRNDRLSGTRAQSPDFDYQDIRDDRVYTYFNLKGGQSKTFTLRLHGAYPGRYYLPPVQVEAMYDNGIAAQNTGEWIEVVKPGGRG